MMLQDFLNYALQAEKANQMRINLSRRETVVLKRELTLSLFKDLWLDFFSTQPPCECKKFYENFFMVFRCELLNLNPLVDYLCNDFAMSRGQAIATACVFDSRFKIYCMYNNSNTVTKAQVKDFVYPSNWRFGEAEKILDFYISNIQIYQPTQGVQTTIF